ncbi:MAG TPA: helix-turn-helix domain-containing protein [Bacteroidia bacterium]|nr:helix-turn-helix domain-containing protein [Bacteroidia bacterium]
MDQEQMNALITVIGEEQIEKAFDLVGSEKISFSRLRLWVRKRRVEKALREGQSFARIAKRFEISRMTVYRIFKKENQLKKCRS